MDGTRARDEQEKDRKTEVIVPARYPGRWIAATIIFVLFASFAY